MDAWVAEMRDSRKGTVACQEKTDTFMDCKEPTSENMDSGAEHREAPMEDSIVKPARGWKKWQRGQHLAAGRCGEPEELTRGDCGSQGKLAATCRQVSCCAAVAWCKRNVFRNIRTQGFCGPWQELGATGVRMTLRARVEWHKGNVIKKNSTTYNVEQGTCKEWAFGKRHGTKPKGSHGVKNRNVKEQLYLR
jgi:hypothetical protein